MFDLLKRNGKVSVCIMLKPDSIVYTELFESYKALDVGEFTHYRINHSKAFVNDKSHINGIENF